MAARPGRRAGRAVSARLCLLGPESTGKTRLAGALAAHFGASQMPEYGRYFDIFHKQGVDGDAKGEDWRDADFVKLAETHIAMRDAMAGQAPSLIVEDTDILQTAIWADFLLGRRSPPLERLLRVATIADHYLVLSPEVDWIDDGVRYAGKKKTRRWFFDEAVKRVRAAGATFDIVSGDDWAQRTSDAIAYAEARFGAPAR